MQEAEGGAEASQAPVTQCPHNQVPPTWNAKVWVSKCMTAHAPVRLVGLADWESGEVKLCLLPTSSEGEVGNDDIGGTHLPAAAGVVARTSGRVPRATAAFPSSSQTAPLLALQRSMVSCGKTGRRGAVVQFLLEDGRAGLPCPWEWCLRSLALMRV